MLRVDNPHHPDLTRSIPPMSGGVSTKSSFLNRNKRSITLDLKIAESIVLIKRLIGDYDIIVEQFRPGVMDRLGLGYKQLQEINPRLIYCSISGYGQTGPYAHKAGHDINYMSISGINGYSGRRGDRTPLMGVQVADVAGGSLHGVIGILAAVNQRNQTGEGQHVDISMTDAVFSLNAMVGADYLGAGQTPVAGEELLNGGSYYDYYKTSDDRYISVGSIEPQFFKRLCSILGVIETPPQGCRLKPEYQAALKEKISYAFSKKTLAEWVDIYSQYNACVEPVLSMAEA